MANKAEFEKSIDKAIDRFNETLLENMQMAADVVANDAKKRVGVQTGALRADIKTEVAIEDGEIVGRVGNTLEYAVWHHQGTGIYAKDGNGRKKVPWVYRDPKTGKFYKTSGTKPNPYLANARDAQQGNVSKLLGGG